MALTENHIDYINYNNLFKGNYVRGVRVLENMLNVPAQAEDLIANPTALHVLIGGVDMQTKRLLDVIRASRYATRIAQTFIDYMADTPEEFIEAVSADVLTNVISLTPDLDESLYYTFWRLDDFEERYFSMIETSADGDRVRRSFFTGFTLITAEEFQACSYRLLHDVSPFVHTAREKLLHLVGTTKAFPITVVGSSEASLTYVVPAAKQNQVSVRLIDLAHGEDVDGNSIGFTFTFTTLLGLQGYNYSAVSRYRVDKIGVKYPEQGNADTIANHAMLYSLGALPVMQYVRQTKRYEISSRYEYWYNSTNFKTTANTLSYPVTPMKFWLPNFREIFGTKSISYFHSDEPGEQIEWFKTFDNYKNTYITPGSIAYIYINGSSAGDINCYTGSSYTAQWNSSSYISTATASTINSNSTTCYLHNALISSSGGVAAKTTDSSVNSHYLTSAPCFGI